MSTMPNGSTPSSRSRRPGADRKSTRLNSSHLVISYAVFCLKKKICVTTVQVLCGDVMGPNISTYLSYISHWFPHTYHTRARRRSAQMHLAVDGAQDRPYAF